MYKFQKSNKGNDGEVVIFKIPKDSIKFSDGDTASVISNIVKLPYDIKSGSDENDTPYTRNGINHIKRKHNGFKKEFIKSELSLKKKYKKKYGKKYSCYNINRFFNKHCKSISLKNYPSFLSERIIEKINKDWRIAYLLNDIREEKPHFQPHINYEDFFRVIPIRPTLNNQRIIRQDGYFFYLA